MIGYLPNTQYLYQAIWGDAEEESQDENAGHLDCLHLSLADVARSTLVKLLGPPVDEDNDGKVAGNHHQQGQQPYQAEGHH